MGLHNEVPLDVSESWPCVETEVPQEAIQDDRNPIAYGFVTRSTKEVLDRMTLSGPPTWVCICACKYGVEDRGTTPRPLLDVDVDAEREFDEEIDAWRWCSWSKKKNCGGSWMGGEHWRWKFYCWVYRTRVGREGLGRTLHWLVLCAPFVPRVPVGQRLRRMCRLVIKSWNILSLRNRKWEINWNTDVSKSLLAGIGYVCLSPAINFLCCSTRISSYTHKGSRCFPLNKKLE